MYPTGALLRILLVIVGLSICVLGCAHKSTETNKHAQVDFSKVGKLAVIKFSGIASSAASQEAANLLSLAFMQKGNKVIDTSNILALAEQDRLYTEVLTPEVKAKFNKYGVDVIVLGTVHDYSCTHVANWFLASFQIDAYRTYCRANISVKMIKLDSGEILWGTSRSGEDAGDDINAGTVLRSIMQELEYELPGDAARNPL